MSKQSDENIEFVRYIAKRTIEFSIYEYSKGVGNTEKQQNNYLSAKRFLVSEWFSDLCFLIGLQPDYLKRKVIKDFS